MSPVFRALALLLIVTSPALAVEELPFPLKTTELKTDGQRFYVEGRQRILRNAKVVSLRATTIRGRGPNAVLEVEGTLEMRAVTGGKVKVENLRIELMPRFRKLSIMNTEFIGTSSVESATGESHEGRVYIAGTKFNDKTRLSLAMTGGDAIVSGCHFVNPVLIDGVPRSEKAGSNVKVRVMGCTGRDQGIWGGITIRGGKDVVLSGCDLAGDLVGLDDNRDLQFISNNVRPARIEFRQSKSGKFGRTEIKTCDFRTPDIALGAPPRRKAPERLVMESCWFGGSVDEDQIRAEKITDVGKDPELGVIAVLKKIRPSPLGFGGTRN